MLKHTIHSLIVRLVINPVTQALNPPTSESASGDSASDMSGPFY